MPSNPKSNEPEKWLSKCHDAPVIPVLGDEGTGYWVCSECKQSCDVATPPTMDFEGEVREIAQEQFVGLYMRDAEGNFVPVDDKYSVLADSLTAAVTAAVLRALPERDTAEVDGATFYEAWRKGWNAALDAVEATLTTKQEGENTE